MAPAPERSSPPDGTRSPASLPDDLTATPPVAGPRGQRGLGALVDRCGPDVFLTRALLASTWIAASLYCALLAFRAQARGQAPYLEIAAGALLLVALAGPHLPRPSLRPLPWALLAGSALAALTVLNRAYDPMVFGLYVLALVHAALVMDGRGTAAITVHYILYYALFNVLVADSEASPHWESLLAMLLIFGGIALAVWSLVAGQRWLRASRQAVEAANAQLAASLAREQRFVGDAAHQLRTPLAILRASIELLAGQRAPDAATVQRTLGEVAREADRLARTLDDLLALTRADAGMAIARETVDLLELADEVYRLGRRLPGGERLRLDLGEAPECWDWLVQGDERLLQQLLLNLVDNALKYSPSDQPVTLTLAAAPDAISIAVVDRGTGIPPEEQERIFERFYRAPQARAAGTPGSGLGLCLARWIAEAHSARLEVDSAPGRGSTFRLSLRPWQSEASKPSCPPPG